MRTAIGAPASALFLGDRSTETAVRTGNLSRYRILAFATHGLTAGELRGLEQPGLVFTPPQSPSDWDNFYLTAAEVAAMRRDADWVILSACNNAAGDGSEGAPGLSGLARSFFHAGARALLVSHWPVDDEIAARLSVGTIMTGRGEPAARRARRCSGRCGRRGRIDRGMGRRVVWRIRLLGRRLAWWGMGRGELAEGFASRRA